jgi:radical SAM protein with 4Fe4S-binding SPASM domain|tara:strand:+ start:174 stop:1262 length:1089 start_codon:yes stop_codon:yes gene_type:complete
MYDINFIAKSIPTKTKISKDLLSKNDCDTIENELEKLRDSQPHIFNIETTNYCNMTCVMCPRTLYMTRKNIWIDDKMFEDLVDKINPYSENEIEGFWKKIESHYNINKDEVSENAFYFSVVSRCLILHGYGEPFLDKKLIDRIKICTKKKIPTYFSCTPANMTVEKAIKAMEAGLTVLKFSIDALDNEEIKKIRGRKANFSTAMKNILKLLEEKKKRNLKTLVVPCMIKFDDNKENKKMHENFLDFWKDHDVYAYIKSQDNRWYFEKNKSMQNLSHYAKQYCEYPWSSLTVMADGNIVPCTQIPNNEIVLGNVKIQTLEEIWNGEKYKEFRKMHITGNFPEKHKCKNNCDQVKLYEYLGEKY